MQAERGTGPVTGYTAKQSVTATKTDTPILETPQSISVVTKDQATAQGAQTLSQALRYVPGVTLDLYSANTFFDAIKVRGFDAPQYLDGLRLPRDPGTQFAIPRIEPYGLERFEVLKGPSSGLYGQTEPGGLVNMVSKRPIWTPFVEIVGQTGSFDRLQGAFDVGGPVGGKDSKVAYRVTGLVRDANSQYDFQQDNKVFIAPSFTVQPTPDTTFTFLSHFQKIDNKGFQQYIPGVGSLYFNPNGRIPSNRYLGEPAVDGYRLEQYGIGYAFEHRINEVFQFRQNLRFLSAQNDMAATRIESLSADARRGNRAMHYVFAETRNLAVDNQLQADFFTGPFKHKVLAGVDYIHTKSHSDYRQRWLDAIDMFSPSLRLPRSAGRVIDSVHLERRHAEPDRRLSSGPDQVRPLHADAHRPSRRGEHGNHRSPCRHQRKPRTTAANTGRVGLSYLFDFGLAPYVSYSTSFNPVLGSDRLGSPFKPTTGEGKEIGVKYQAPGSNLLFTAAVFDIKQQNVLTPDPADPLFQRADRRSAGEGLRVRGARQRHAQPRDRRRL